MTSLTRNLTAKSSAPRNRPLPSGRVTVKAALVFLAALLLVGLATLLQFNWPTILTGMASLIIVAVYPFMKRITHWPQAVLGLAFNWGALLGWMAITATLTAAPLFLYAGGVFWTLAYDTIYAHQDKDDDILIGVKSTALMFGDATRGWLGAFFVVALVFFAMAAGLAGAGFWSYAGLVAAAVHAVWQCRKFDGNDSSLCLKLFKSNRTFGLLVLLGFLLDGFLT